MPINNKEKQDWVRICFVSYIDPEIPCHPEVIAHLVKETPEMFMVDMIYRAIHDVVNPEGIEGYEVRYDQRIMFYNKPHILYVEPLSEDYIDDEGFHPENDYE